MLEMFATGLLIKVVSPSIINQQYLAFLYFSANPYSHAMIWLSGFPSFTGKPYFPSTNVAVCLFLIQRNPYSHDIDVVIWLFLIQFISVPGPIES